MAQTEPTKTPMIDEWASRLDERRTITEFWEWLVEQSDPTTTVFDIHIEKTLDRFHEIDQTQLDKERQAVADCAGAAAGSMAGTSASA